MTSSIDPRVYVLTFAGFVMLSSEFIVAGLLPEIAASLGLTLGQAGWLVSAFAIGMGVSAPIVTLFTHSASKRSLLIAACLALLAGNVLSAVSSYFPVLLAGRVLGGVGVAVYWTNAGLAARALSRGRNEDVAMARILIGISIASVIGVPLGKLVSDASHWEMAMWMMAVLSAVALGTVLIWVHPVEEADTSEHQRFWPKLRAAWNRDIALCLISVALILAGIASLFNYLAAFLAQYSGFSAHSVTLLLAMYGVADIVGNLYLSKRVRADLEPLFRRVLWVLLAGLCAVSATGSLPWAVPLAVATVAFGHAGISLLLGIDILRRAGNGAEIISSINVSMVNVGITLGAVTAGLMVDHVGIQYVGVLAAVWIGAALLVRGRLKRFVSR